MVTLVEDYADVALVVFDVEVIFAALDVATGARRVRPNGFN